jgi:hypothetical protein
VPPSAAMKLRARRANEVPLRGSEAARGAQMKE